MELDHIGIAVGGLEESAHLFQAATGWPLLPPEKIAGEAVEVSMVQASSDPGGCKLELLHSTDPGSALGRFLEKHGPGLHHLAVRVDSLEEAMVHFAALGLQIIGEPRTGAGGCRFVFIHPRSTGGILLELLQRD